MNAVDTTAEWKISRRMVTERAFQRTFFGASALLFAGSAAVTIVWCTSMSGMGEMPMPGGWTMSMAWMRMPGQTWPGAAASFLGMWIVMMVAMMLPSVAPMLWRYCQAASRTVELPWGRKRGHWGRSRRTALVLTALVGMGYFSAWTLFGVAAFVLGVVLAAVTMQWPALARAVPMASGVVVLITGALQFTSWKAHHLACCRDEHGCHREDGLHREEHGCCRTAPADAGMVPVDAAMAWPAWRYGVRLGFHCGACCAGLTAILLVMGVMDLWAMAVVTAAITLERLSPAGNHAARAIGFVVVGAGMLLIARAAGLG